MTNTPMKHNAEERKAQAEALHASILEQVQQLTVSGRWQQFLDFARSFHQYSLNNLLLILAQHPNATMIAGYRQWQAKGRQVRKGETGIKIFGHSTKKATTDDDDQAEEDQARQQRVRHYFPVLSVFDITQTDPIPGATTPENPIQQLTGHSDHGILEPLTTHLERNGWTLSHQPLTRANGYTDPEQRAVILSDGLAPEQAAKTLLHETAHITLGHTDNLTEYRKHRGRMEVEAESVAYIAAGLTGFDTSNYSIGYITSWANHDLTLIHQTATRVLQAAHTIACATTP